VKTTDGQVKKLMKEMGKHGKVGLAAMRAGVDRKTARKYVKAGKLPSELVAPRSWRTRSDPFEEEWPRMVAQREKVRLAPRSIGSEAHLFEPTHRTRTETSSAESTPS
jgi:hypothetical protein